MPVDCNTETWCVISHPEESFTKLRHIHPIREETKKRIMNKPTLLSKALITPNVQGIAIEMAFAIDIALSIYGRFILRERQRPATADWRRAPTKRLKVIKIIKLDYSAISQRRLVRSVFRYALSPARKRS